MKAEGELPVLRVRRVSAGRLEADPDSEIWAGCEVAALREVASGALPRQTTRVRAGWDDRALRILFEAQDALPWATIDVRDGPVWTEEALEIFIDPVGDLESYFEIDINPLGTVSDLVLRRIPNGWRKDFRWQTQGLETRVRITPPGWTAEFLIPFAAITLAPPVPGDVWRVNFLRVDRPSGPGSEADLSAWSPTGIRNFHLAARFGRLEFD